MTSTVYTDLVGPPVNAAWLNDVNTSTYTTVPALAASSLQKANNLSDVANTATARGNLNAAASGSNGDITALTALMSVPTVVTNAINAAASGLQGAFKNLQCSSTGLSAAVNVSADALTLMTAGNAYATVYNLSLSANTGAASGTANSLDTGVWVHSTWYYVFVISNGTTPALLFSLSATAPTMPSGYTYFARVGSIYTRNSVTYYPLGFKQYGRKVRYVVASGGDVTWLPIMVNGAVGTWSTTAPTWSAVSVSAFVPPTASTVTVVATPNYQNLSASLYAVAPNTNYAGPYVTNAPPISNASGPSQVNQIGEFVLESTNLYAASSAAGFALYCMGWEDNL